MDNKYDLVIVWYYMGATPDTITVMLYADSAVHSQEFA